jgi:hypothetical protein
VESDEEPASPAPARKRAKKVVATVDSDEEPASPAPARKRAKRITAVVESDDSDEEPLNPAPTRPRRQVVDSDDEIEDAGQDKENDVTQKSHGDDNQLEAPKDTGATDSDLSSLVDEPPAESKEKPLAATKASAKAGSDSELSSLIDEPLARKRKRAPAAKKSAKPPPKPAAKVDSDSELSSLTDEPPAKKKKKPAAPTKKPAKARAAAESDGQLSSGPDDSDAAPTKSPKRSKKSKGKPSGGASAPDDVLKTLQTQLAKCGIRKQWKRELAAFSSDKERARHLRGLLREAGVTGRFSERVAREIRERRELEGEIRDAEAFERQWGLEAENAAREAKERRRSVAQQYAQLGFGSDEGEEE